jgi:mRNA interferase RelE/StbE
MYQVLISKTARKQLQELPKAIANNISQKIDTLSKDPRPEGCKKLQGSQDDYRVRVGDYRIVYRIENKMLIVEVIRIGHRKDVYKKK